MFTWICPKCGKEVPPAYSECPNCAAGPGADTPAPTPPQAAPPRSAAPAESRHRSWLIGGLVGAVIIVVVLTALAVLRTRRPAATTSAAPPAATAPLQSAPAAVPAPASPALKNLELTGFRLTEDAQKRPQLQFVVVNHSAADLGDLKLQANLRAANAGAADPPVATFAFSTSLGPFETRDLKVPIQTSLRAYELPDWQLLRADIIAQ